MLSLPPLLTQCCLGGLRIHQGNIGGKATLIRGRGGEKDSFGLSGYQGKSSHSIRSVSTVLSEIVPVLLHKKIPQIPFSFVFAKLSTGWPIRGRAAGQSMIFGLSIPTGYIFLCESVPNKV